MPTATCSASRAACARGTPKNGIDYCAWRIRTEVTNGVITVTAPAGSAIDPCRRAGRRGARSSARTREPPPPPSGERGHPWVAGVTVTIPAGVAPTCSSRSSSPASRGLTGGQPGLRDRANWDDLRAAVAFAFEYTDNELAGLAPSDFAVETSTPELGASWTPLTQIVVDVYAHTIAGQTTHLSPYALVSQRAGGGGTSTTQADGGPAMGGADAACTNPCTAGLTQCTSGAVQTCQTRANGCTQWVTAATCGTNQTCTVTGLPWATASCTCNSTQCAEAGTVCQNAEATCHLREGRKRLLLRSRDVALCHPDVVLGCGPRRGVLRDVLRWLRKVELRTPRAAWRRALSEVAAGRTRLPVACGAHQSCTGTAGAAICTCNNVPSCIAPGASCATVTSLVVLDR